MSSDVPIDNLVTQLSDMIERGAATSLNRRLALQRDWESALRREAGSHGNVLTSDINNSGLQGAESIHSLSAHYQTQAKSMTKLEANASERKPIAYSRPGGAFTAENSTPNMHTQLQINNRSALTGIAVLLLGAGEQTTNAAPKAQVVTGSSWLLQPMKSIAWSPFAVHVVYKGNELKVWIRDKNLGHKTGYRMLVELRRQLSGSGLRVAQIVINGKVQYSQ